MARLGFEIGAGGFIPDPGRTTQQSIETGRRAWNRTPIEFPGLKEYSLPQPVEPAISAPFIPGMTLGLVGPVAAAVGTTKAATAIGASPTQALIAGAAGGAAAFAMDRYGGRDPSAIGEPWWFEGPGLHEPPSDYLVKEWKRRIDSREGDYNLQYYLVKLPGRPYRIWMYSQKTRVWKSWGLPTPAVIGKNMPSHKMLTRLRRNLKRHKDDAKTILKIADPAGFLKTQGYQKRRTHRR